MSITLAELKALLDIDEPDYAALAVMAAGAMTHLRKLAASSDVSLASKAVSLAGMIGGTSGVNIVTAAAGSEEVLVRLAAAHAVGFLPDHAKVSEVIQGLLADDDLGVVKVASTAASAQGVRAAAVNTTEIGRAHV